MLNVYVCMYIMDLICILYCVLKNESSSRYSMEKKKKQEK